MRQGADTADAAKAARLPDLLVGLLRTAAGADMAELLRFVARYYDGRFSRGVVLLRAALVPAAAIGTGVPVCLFVLSLYLPLIRLIDGMSEFICTICCRIFPVVATRETAAPARAGSSSSMQ